MPGEVGELESLVSKTDVPASNPEVMQEYKEAMRGAWTTMTRPIG
jgi:hypothetical protein